MRWTVVGVCNGRIWISRRTESNCMAPNRKPILSTKSGGSLRQLPWEDNFVITKTLPGKKRRAKVLQLLKHGVCPFEILRHMDEWDPAQFWALVDFLQAHDRINEALQVFQWCKKQAGYRARGKHYTPFIQMICKAQMPTLAWKLFNEMRCKGFQPSLSTMATLMLSYADCGFIVQSMYIWDEITDCGLQPDIDTCANLIDTFGKMEHFDEVAKIFNEIKSAGWIRDAKIYATMISCYGKGGQLGLMEKIMKEMLLSGFRPDSQTFNSIVQSYSYFGSLNEMEESYRWLKAYGIFIEAESIRAMAFAYIQNERFYQLGEFVRDVGLRRKNAGNLLWNLLLLSYAANFKMKNLQREFLNMREAGFEPDLTTFNIRALAFSKMHMFWDLYISVLHMQQMDILPDLVMYGAVVDSYLNGKLAKKLSFALSQMKMHNLYPTVLTDPLVFEAFGKGDFHACVENLLQFSDQKWLGKWTYSKLVGFYLKKHFRRGQLFWNY